LAKWFDGEPWLLVEESGGTIVAMNLNQLASGVFMGSFLVILGLVPGLLSWINHQRQQLGKSFSPALLDATDGRECLTMGYPGRFGSRD
jgi:hypothetical protein